MRLLTLLLFLGACGPASDDDCTATSWYPDRDGDGVGSQAGAVEACTAPEGYVPAPGDCDDGDPAVHPGAADLCNGVDDDCNGAVDDFPPDGAPSWYLDDDGDGWGRTEDRVLACEAPRDHVADDGDCDDADAEVYPGAEEACDGVDQDCDGTADEGCPAACGDGVLDPGETCDGEEGDCPGACSGWCHCPSLPAGDLEVHVLDVGQGDAIVVRLPSGFVLSVDAGGSGMDARVAAWLEAEGIHTVDYFLASHFHDDHIAGLPDLLAAHPEAVACVDHGGLAISDTSLEWIGLAGERRVPVEAGDLLALDPAVEALVLHAWHGWSNENHNSVVLRLTWRDRTVLLGGDCETWGCEFTFDPGPIDVYKVHHHGSHDSSGQEILDQMLPRLAVIPVGPNSYGHPAGETLQRLAGVGAEVLRTDRDGDIHLRTDGGDWTWTTGTEP